MDVAAAGRSPPGAAVGAPLDETSRLPWRERATPATLRRDGRLWTAWTVCISTPFVAAGGLLVWLEPLLFPVTVAAFAHAWAIPAIQAARGARSAVPIGSERSAARGPEADAGAERMALGLLGDLVDHRERELPARTGLAMHRGRVAVWLVGEQGAISVRPGGRRVDCWCVRVGDPGELPAGDRVAHLLLALREDECGFATVANLAFSGAPWRVRRRLPRRARPALDAARAEARAVRRAADAAPRVAG